MLLAMAANSSEVKARALEQCERDLDVAIERLVNLRLDASDGGGGAGAHHHHHDVVHPATVAADDAEDEEEEEQRTVAGAVHAPSGDGRAERIEMLVEAMAGAESWDDARARAARVLDDLGAAAAARCRAERDAAVSQNGVLKKAVVVQHRLCKEKEAANRALQRQLAACQERVRSLEVDNYALSMYLRNAQPPPQVTGRFHHPEVF